jgi:hypothetical protein
MKQPENASDNTGEVSVMRVLVPGAYRTISKLLLCLNNQEIGTRDSGMRQEHYP